MVDPVLDGLADTKHHGRGGAHAELVCGAMHQEPIRGQAFQARDFVADFIVKDLSAAARNRIQSSVAQARNRIAYAEIAVLGNRENFRGGVNIAGGFSESAA